MDGSRLSAAEFHQAASRGLVLCRLAWGFFQALSSCLQSSSPGHWRTERVVVLLAVGCGPPLGLETPQCSCYVVLSHTSLSLLLKWRLKNVTGFWAWLPIIFALFHWVKASHSSRSPQKEEITQRCGHHRAENHWGHLPVPTGVHKTHW